MGCQSSARSTGSQVKRASLLVARTHAAIVVNHRPRGETATSEPRAIPEPSDACRNSPGFETGVVDDLAIAAAMRYAANSFAFDLCERDVFLEPSAVKRVEIGVMPLQHRNT